MWEHLEGILGHVCEQKAAVCSAPWDALGSGSVTSPVPGLSSDQKETQKFCVGFFFFLMEAGDFWQVRVSHKQLFLSEHFRALFFFFFFFFSERGTKQNGQVLLTKAPLFRHLYPIARGEISWGVVCVFHRDFRNESLPGNQIPPQKNNNKLFFPVL